MAIALSDELQERGTEALYGHGLMDCRIMRKSETLLYGKISDSFDSGGASSLAVESHPSTKKATNNHLLVALIAFSRPLLLRGGIVIAEDTRRVVRPSFLISLF